MIFPLAAAGVDDPDDDELDEDDDDDDWFDDPHPVISAVASAPARSSRSVRFMTFLLEFRQSRWWP
jgi:hypothetical protein